MTRLFVARSSRITAAIVFALLFSTIGRTRTRQVNPTDQPTGPSVKKLSVVLLSETHDEIQARFLIPRGRAERSTNGDRIEIAGAVSRNIEGQPDTPVFRQLVAIPECADLSIRVEPSKRSVLVGVTLNDYYTEYASFQDASNWRLSQRTSNSFPGYLARIRDGGRMRGQRLAVLELCPVQYDGWKREVVLYEELLVTITIENPTSAFHENAGPMEAALRSVVINPVSKTQASEARHKLNSGDIGFETGTVCWISDSTAVGAAASVSACGADYLIIVADTLSHGADSTQIHDLADWRSSYNGFNVAIVRVRSIIDYCDPYPLTCRPDTVDTPTAIRNFIKDVYDDASAEHMGDGRLAYVLLIGDTFDPERNVLLPMYYFTSGPLYNAASFGCDGPYAHLTAANPLEDAFPDVFLGRLPVDADPTNWEITNVVARILNYEPLPSNAGWASKVLLVSGGDSAGFGFSGLAGFQAFFDSTDSRYIPASRSVTQMHVLDPAYASDSTFSAAVADSMRAGFGLVGMFDHGVYFVYRGTPPHGYTVLPIHFDDLDTDRAPFVLAVGSHLGEADYTADKRGKDVWGGGEGPCAPSLTGSCVLAQSDSDIDSCDVLAERLIVQSKGAIGVLALNRSMIPPGAVDAWNNFWDTQYAHNVTSSGQELVLNKLRGGGIETTWIHGLSLFGDPAVNLRWLDGANDGIDLAIRNSDVGPYASTGSYLQVTVRNEGPEEATDVEIEVWRGNPDVGGSTLIGSHTAPTISAYDTVVVNVPATVPEGKHRLFVRLNPDFDIDEPTYDNNTAFSFCFGLPYLPGYPIKLAGTPHHGALIADVHSAPGLELLYASQTRLYCRAASGSLLWSFGRSAGTVRTGPIVANFGKHGVPLVLWESAGYTFLLNPANGSIVDSTSVGAQPSSLAQSYAVGDLVSGDGNLEYVGHYGSYFEAHEATGSLKWQVSPTASYEHAGIAIADIDLDGTTEVMISTGLTLRVYNGQTGSLIWQRPLGLRPMRNELVTFDSDGDGDLELLTTSSTTASTATVALYSNSGSLLWSYVLAKPAFSAVVGMAVADIHRTGAPEAIVAHQSKLRSLNASGVVTDSVNALGLYQGLLVGDILGDEDLEVITHGPKLLQVFDPDLTPLDTLYFATDISESPAIGDINADGDCDVVLLTSDGHLHVLPLGTKTGELPWSMTDSNAMHTSTYAQPIVGNYSRRVSLLNTVHVLGDAICDSSLYIDGSAHVRISNSDATSSGSDASRTEIWVKGHINARGSSLQPIVLEGWDGVTRSSDADAWWAISDTSSTARASFRYTTIRNAARGVGTRRPLTMTNCLIEDCEDRGINAAVADSVVVDSTIIRGSDFGINALQGTTVLLRNSSIENCPLYGVAVYKNSTLRAKTTTFYGNDVGVYVAREAYAWASGMVRSCTFAGNDTGVWIDDSGSSSVTVNLCTIDNNTSNGIYIEDDSDALVTRNTITDGSTGIFSYNSGPMIDRSNRIEQNGNGIKCDGSSYAAVESCQVNNNNYGITVVSGSPNIGTVAGGDNTNGYNILKPNTTYNVRNLTGLTVSAQQNYWPQKATAPMICYPKPSTIYGSVDTTAALCAQPSLSSRGAGDDGKRVLPRSFELSQNYPNPFNPSTTIKYQLAALSDVKIDVYDVAGRLVAELVSGQQVRGAYSVTWHGLDRRGHPAASGVYFVRMQAGKFVHTKKILLLK